jgi:outer membrane protein assembly factor BamB
MLAGLLLAGCGSRGTSEAPPRVVPVASAGKGKAPPGPSWKPSTPATAVTKVEVGPVLVGHRIVEPQTGKVKQELADLAGGKATPLGVGHYAIGSSVVDTRTGSVTPEPAFPRIESGKVLGRTATGGQWSFPLTGVRSVRPPDLAVTKRMVVVAVDSELIGLDRKTGKVRWRIAAPNDRLHAAGDVVVSVDSNGALPANTNRWLIARRPSDGSEVFRVELPHDSDPEALVDVGSFLLVRNDRSPASMLVDRTGHVVLKLDERISAAERLQGDWLVVTEKRIARLSPKGETRWELPGFANDFVMGSGVVMLPDGDAVFYNFGRISDSGVELARVALHDGKVRWRRRTEALGVGHSEYHHVAYVRRIPNEELAVVSQGSAGSWLEIVDVETGKERRRWTYP